MTPAKCHSISRQDNSKRRPFSHLAFNLNFSALCFSSHLTKRQTKSNAIFLAFLTCFNLEEFIEDFIQKLNLVASHPRGAGAHEIRKSIKGHEFRPRTKSLDCENSGYVTKWGVREYLPVDCAVTRPRVTYLSFS